MYAYECECNVYRTCSNGAIAKASAVLIALTTSNYRPLIKIKNKKITHHLNKQNLKATPQQTTVLQVYDKPVCLDGSFNTAQYVLVIMTNCFLLISSLLFHFSFHGLCPLTLIKFNLFIIYDDLIAINSQGSLVETFFFVLVIILTFLCLTVCIIFWINPLSKFLYFFNQKKHIDYDIT